MHLSTSSIHTRRTVCFPLLFLKPHGLAMAQVPSLQCVVAPNTPLPKIHTTLHPEKRRVGKKRNAPRNTLSEDRLRALREKDAERKRNRRVQMTEEERRCEREKDKARKANKRRKQRLESAKQAVVLPPVSTLLRSAPCAPLYPVSAPYVSYPPLPPLLQPPRVSAALGLNPIVDLPNVQSLK